MRPRRLAAAVILLHGVFIHRSSIARREQKVTEREDRSGKEGKGRKIVEI